MIDLQEAIDCYNADYKILGSKTNLFYEDVINFFAGETLISKGRVMNEELLSEAGIPPMMQNNNYLSGMKNMEKFITKDELINTYKNAGIPLSRIDAAKNTKETLDLFKTQSKLKASNPGLFTKILAWLTSKVTALGIKFPKLSKGLLWLLNPVRLKVILGTAGGVLLIAAILKSLKKNNMTRQAQDLQTSIDTAVPKTNDEIGAPNKTPEKVFKEEVAKYKLGIQSSPAGFIMLDNLSKNNFEVQCLMEEALKN